MLINCANTNYDKYLTPPSNLKENKEVESGYYEIEPKEALKWSFNESLDNLGALIGKDNLAQILNGKEVKSPAYSKKDSSWLKQSNIIGINPRALGSYFDIVKYAMTFPEDAIHLLPLFEQGCTASLYAPVNFKLSEEFLDKDLARLGFKTPESQLKLTVNLLHALGKNVGFDFLQHTDRFSQEVFVNPDNFIWAKLDDNSEYELNYPKVHPDNIGEEVKKAVVEFLRQNGDSNNEEISEIILNNFYSYPPNKRMLLLFGKNDEKQGSKRRVALMNFVRDKHLETKPLSIDDPRTRIVFKEMMSNENASWAVFTDNRNDKIFGNLTAYKLYHLDKDGNPDISRPNKSAWDFILNQTSDFQKEYGFDFLRADMGYLSFDDDNLDIHAKLKETIQKNSKHFATFGECFAGFSDENPRAIQRKNYDAVLGNLQYKNVYDYDFLNTVKAYNFNPDYKVAVTSITTDSDQECYNEHYDDFQNKIRCFFGLFLNQPSYMGMGLETRETGTKDEAKLTKNFINDWGNEKYIWGENREFFDVLSGLRRVYSSIKDTIRKQAHYWLWTTDNKVASWFYHDNNKPSFVFVSNTDTFSKRETEIQNPLDTGVLDEKTDKVALKQIYSTERNKLEGVIISKGKKFKVTNLAPGESRIYKVVKKED